MNYRKRDSNNRSLSRYLEEIHHDILSSEEEIALAREAKQGKEEAFQKMVEHNLRFVVKIAKEYDQYAPKMSLEERISSGNLGLIRAVNKFDETRGFRFISYAVWWIKQSIMGDYEQKFSGIVRRPVNNTGLATKVYKEKTNYMKNHEGEIPSPEYLSEKLDVSVEKILDTDRQPEISLDKEFGEDRSLLNILENPNSKTPYEDVNKESVRYELEDAMKQTLDDREYDILKKYFGFEGSAMTLKQIGEEYDLTRERIRQIKVKGIMKMRKNKEARKTYQELQ